MPSFQSFPHGPSQLLKKAPKRKRGWFGTLILGLVGFVVAYYLVCASMIFSLKWINPPTTAVRMQRELGALWNKRTYREHHAFVPVSRIAPDLQRAVIAAEDGRFYVHHGFDWLELQKVMQTDLKNKTLGRGASTITQQLVKNLFLGTERSVVKKGIEFTLVPIVEFCLTKDRILELYLNEIEWGPGIFGAEAAAEHWYHTSASQLTRDQATRLAAIIPSPLKRAPAREDEYSAEIQQRMKTMGW